LTLFEKDYTTTNHQTSLAIKSIFAQMINCIVIPLICNRYIKGKIYVVDGLTDNIFMLSLTTALVPPILLLFDPYALFIRFKVWLKSRPCNFVLI
jgi:hypothetical protein